MHRREIRQKSDRETKHSAKYVVQAVYGIREISWILSRKHGELEFREFPILWSKLQAAANLFMHGGILGTKGELIPIPIFDQTGEIAICAPMEIGLNLPPDELHKHDRVILLAPQAYQSIKLVETIGESCVLTLDSPYVRDIDYVKLERGLTRWFVDCSEIYGEPSLDNDFDLIVPEALVIQFMVDMAKLNDPEQAELVADFYFDPRES